MCNTNDFYVETENDVGPEEGPGNPEHSLGKNRVDGEQKPIDDLNKLDEIIRNPDRILDFHGGQKRYILKEFEDGVAIITMGENKKFGAKTVYELITQLKDSDGGLFDSFGDAEEEAKDQESPDEEPEEPSDVIDC